MKKRILIALGILLSAALNMVAQYTLSGTVIDGKDNVPVGNCDIVLIAGDSISYEAKTSADGGFSISDIKPGAYILEASSLGYELQRRDVDLTADLSVSILMTPLKSTALDEVTVTADKSDIVKRTANGQIFYLSKEARAMSNPFMALMEIPLLISDPNNSSLTTINSSKTLILINGNRVNSGVSPLNPSDIEYVEVITNPSARYMLQGYNSIINIKIKPKAKPYLWLELATRHELPVDYGFGSAQFEIGNPKVSLYGRASASYNHKETTSSMTHRHFTDYSQKFSQNSRSDSHNVVGELLLKGNPTSSDYYAAYFYVEDKLAKSKYDGAGEFDSSSGHSYDFRGNSRNKSTIATASAYYKRSFSLKHEMEIRIYYNYNKNRLNNDRTDSYTGIEDDLSCQLFRNRRHSGRLQLDYSNNYRENAWLTAGSSTTFENDHINHAFEPFSLFRHRNITEYFYVGWQKKTGSKVWLGISAGAEIVWIKAADKTNNYTRPHGNMSIVWNINPHHSLDLYYRLTNTSPSVSQLNPFNTSTDKMFISRGNPYLKPQWMQYIPLTYTYNNKGLYMYGTAYYKRIHDKLSATGYADSDGVFVSTYENFGKLQQICLTLYGNYRFKNGGVNATVSFAQNYFKRQDSHTFMAYSLGGNWRIGPVSLYGNFYYLSRDVNEISVRDYHKPSRIDIQANYNFTPDFYVGACLRNITGKYNYTDYLSTTDYRQTTDMTFNYRGPSVFFIIRYTLRKNKNRKINLDNVLQSTEEGIKL